MTECISEAAGFFLADEASDQSLKHVLAAHLFQEYYREESCLLGNSLGDHRPHPFGKACPVRIVRASSKILFMDFEHQIPVESSKEKNI